MSLIPTNVQFPFKREQSRRVESCNDAIQALRGTQGMELLFEERLRQWCVVRWDWALTGAPVPIPLLMFSKPSADRRRLDNGTVDNNDAYVFPGAINIVEQLGACLVRQESERNRALDERLAEMEQQRNKQVAANTDAWFDKEHDAMDATITKNKKALGRNAFGGIETDGSGPNHGSKFYGSKFDRNVVTQ